MALYSPHKLVSSAGPCMGLNCCGPLRTPAAAAVLSGYGLLDQSWDLYTQFCDASESENKKLDGFIETAGKPLTTRFNSLAELKQLRCNHTPPEAVLCSEAESKLELSQQISELRASVEEWKQHCEAQAQATAAALAKEADHRRTVRSYSRQRTKKGTLKGLYHDTDLGSLNAFKSRTRCRSACLT